MPRSKDIASIARFRSKLNRQVRTFFDERDFLEVETPTVSPYLIPEAHIEIFSTNYFSDTRGERELYLIPSPEVHMKQLIAEGSGSIYQISRSFRNNEQLGRHHNPEFSMLEWYLTGGDSKDNIGVTEELFSTLLSAFPVANQEARKALEPPFRRMSMAEAWQKLAGIDLENAMDLPRLRRAAGRAGIDPRGKEESWEELFHRIFLTLIEPELPRERPLVLEGYPAKIDTLARPIPGTPWLDRWELYVNGTELANCYNEERSWSRMENFFRQEYAIKATSCRVIPEYDPALPEIFSTMPPVSGVALGMDRLAMLFSGSPSLEGVILFPLSAMLDPR